MQRTPSPRDIPNVQLYPKRCSHRLPLWGNRSLWRRDTHHQEKAPPGSYLQAIHGTRRSLIILCPRAHQKRVRGPSRKRPTALTIGTTLHFTDGKWCFFVVLVRRVSARNRLFFEEVAEMPLTNRRLPTEKMLIQSSDVLCCVRVSECRLASLIRDSFTRSSPSVPKERRFSRLMASLPFPSCQQIFLIYAHIPLGSDLFILQLTNHQPLRPFIFPHRIFLFAFLFFPLFFFSRFFPSSLPIPTDPSSCMHDFIFFFSPREPFAFSPPVSHSPTEKLTCSPPAEWLGVERVADSLRFVAIGLTLVKLLSASLLVVDVFAPAGMREAGVKCPAEAPTNMSELSYASYYRHGHRHGHGHGDYFFSSERENYRCAWPRHWLG